MGDSEEDKLEKYLAEKAKQAQTDEQEAKPLSAYDACVLKENAKRDAEDSKWKKDK